MYLVFIENCNSKIPWQCEIPKMRNIRIWKLKRICQTRLYKTIFSEVCFVFKKFNLEGWFQACFLYRVAQRNLDMYYFQSFLELYISMRRVIR